MPSPAKRVGGAAAAQLFFRRRPGDYVRQYLPRSRAWLGCRPRRRSERLATFHPRPSATVAVPDFGLSNHPATPFGGLNPGTRLSCESRPASNSTSTAAASAVAHAGSSSQKGAVVSLARTALNTFHASLDLRNDCVRPWRNLRGEWQGTLQAHFRDKLGHPCTHSHFL